MTSTPLERYLASGLRAGCPRDQMDNFLRAGIVLQERQLAASAAARLCDRVDGPTALGYGGARGGGKSHWLLAQMGADDCQRVPGLKCLLLRKVGKANMEHFEDLRRRLFAALDHEFSAYRGVLTFANGSRIIAGHFQNEKDIDAYLGLEYDVIGIEEATTLSSRKHTDISTCCRTSKPNWRPRIYSTTNPGGIGHAWYRAKFILPSQSLASLPHAAAERSEAGLLPTPHTVPSLPHAAAERSEAGPSSNHQSQITNPFPLGQSGQSGQSSPPSVPSSNPQSQIINQKFPPALFIPARVTDNAFNNPEYRKVLESLHGWQRRAWLDGDWDLAAGQYFTNFRRDLHVVSSFDETRAREWFAAMDYGFAHYTVFLLGCTDGDGNVFVVDEHAERLWLPRRHAAAIRAMMGRHRIGVESGWLSVERPETERKTRALELGDLRRIVAGADVFSRQSDGTTIAAQYAREGINLKPANMERVNGWAEVLQRLGEPNVGLACAAGQPAHLGNGEEDGSGLVRPTLFIHQRCGRLIETLPAMQHDPNRPEDVLKVDADEDGSGGDDAADCLRYLVATKARTVVARKLRGV